MQPLELFDNLTQSKLIQQLKFCLIKFGNIIGDELLFNFGAKFQW